jgi:hypothetical protein
MRKVPVLFLFVIVMLPLCGCTTGTPPSVTPTAVPTPTPAPVISISGVVLDSNGATVPDARVALWQGDSLVNAPESIKYAGSDGRFNFTDLQPAHYQITADIQGRQGMVDRRFNDSASIEVVIPDYTVATVTVVPSEGTTPARMPHFEVARLDSETVQVRLTSFGGVTTLRGFYVKSPYLTTPELVPADQSLGESWSATISDPNLRGSSHFVAYSWVNGIYTAVVDTTV